MVTLDVGSLEEWIQPLINYYKALMRTITSMEVGKIDLPSMLLYGEVIRKYELLVTAYGVSTNSHLNFICVCLINELLSTNTLSKYKYEMRRMI